MNSEFNNVVTFILQTPQMLAVAAAMPGKLPNIVAAIPPADSIVEPGLSLKSASSSDGLPPFISMPQSSSQLTDRISNSPTILHDSDNEVSKDDFNQVITLIINDNKLESFNLR